MLKQESIDQIIQQFPKDPTTIIEPISADLFNHFAINLHDQHFPKHELRRLGKNKNRYVLIQTDYDYSVVIYNNPNDNAVPKGVKEHSITNISFNPHGEHQPLPIWYNHFDPKKFDYGHNNQIIEKVVNNSGNIKSLEPTRYNIIYQFETKPFQNQTFNRLIQIDLCLQPSKTSAQIKTLDDRNINPVETLIKAMEQSQYIFLSWGVNDNLWNLIAHQSHFEIQNFYEYLANRAHQNQVFMYTIDEPYSHQPVHSGYRNQKKHLKQVTLDDLNAIFGKTIITL